MAGAGAARREARAQGSRTRYTNRTPARPPGGNARRRWPLPFTSLPSYAAALLPDAVASTVRRCGESELSRRPSFQPSPQLPNSLTAESPAWPVGRVAGQTCSRGLWAGKALATRQSNGHMHSARHRQWLHHHCSVEKPMAKSSCSRTWRHVVAAGRREAS